MRSVLFAFLVMLTAVPALATDGLYNGLVQDGYVYKDGLWYKGNQAYIRSRKAFTFYDGYRKVLSYRYEFEPAPEALTSEPIEGWRKELLEMRAARDKWDAEIKISQEEQKEFLETVKALRLDDVYTPDTSYPSPLQQPSYGGYNGQGGYSLQQQQQGYRAQGSSLAYSAPLAAQGNTLYGYDQYAQAYPDVDLQVLYNQANNLAQQAQRLAGEATADFSALVHQEGERQEEIAKILARGRVAAQVLQLLQDQKSELQINKWSVEKNAPDGNWEVQPAPAQPGGEPQPQPSADLTDEEKQKLFGIISKRCVSCHGPDKKLAGLDMTKFLAFDQETKKKIVATLTTSDPDKRMPKKAGTEPGEPLMDDEIMLFEKAAGITRQSR